MAKLKKAPEDMEYILVTDVGSTTTKARFFSNKSGEWRFVVAGEAPTTVEAPYEDVTMGVQNAVREIEELTGHKILAPDGSGITVPYEHGSGVDLYCTTSSAGGGLQMMVGGFIKAITAESANRAALGAGSIVMDVFAEDDGRAPYQKIRRIRSLRPDMILVAGGTDGGDTTHVIQLIELIKAADPKPRLGVSYNLPLVYAGNKDVRPQAQRLLGENFALEIVDNLRPVLEVENTEPARMAVHELFMEHVMSHAPGYPRLMKWTDVDIMPTPAGEGMSIQLIADTFKKNTIGVGLGGATTNVYSVVDSRFVRSVSANLGMSYSVSNVMKEAGLGDIMRWLPFSRDEEDIGRRLSNKMIRPTTIPQTLEELIIEHSVAREALRLGLGHHKSIATRLKGMKLGEGMDRGTFFDQELAETYIDMLTLEVIAGTGGLLSHAPDRIQSMMILTDAWQPEGVTWMFQDSVFMMPHLGVLSTVYRDAAWNIFDKDCLVRLGTNIAPKGMISQGSEVMKVSWTAPDGSEFQETVRGGEIKRIKLPEGVEVDALVEPAHGLDVGAEPGKSLEAKVIGGIGGVILDGRGRPIQLPDEAEARRTLLREWFAVLEMYPAEMIGKLY
ncbi:MAG: glutamate mutase L [Candidatus Bathyarchaeota archaeon]|nr:glutamate mutase L [Candidatus Bathyarchaeota archaeon]